MTTSISSLELFALQARQFFKLRSNVFVLLIFLAAGMYALYGGYADKRTKTDTIRAFRFQNDSLVDAMKAGIAADTTTQQGKAAWQKSSGLNAALWNTRLPSFKPPVSTALYTIGQSDVLPYYYLFASENFEMQLLKQTEITNPLRALAGHFDISFWIVYLLPLMILLLSFNALSAERDNGNWRMIAAQGISEIRWLQSRFAVVGVLSLSLLVIVMVCGALVNSVAFKQGLAGSDGLFFLSSLIYLIFWLALFYFINSLRQTTAFNALVSGILWIGVCLVVPVLVSRAASALVPVDNIAVSTYSRRPQDIRIDTDKAYAAGIIRRLAAADSSYRNANTDTAAPALLLRTYHALHLLLHKERWPVIQRYFRQVEQRQQVTDWSALLNPAGSTDGYLTALADNDGAAFHHFTEQTEILHSQLHDAFFGSVFTKSRLSKSDYDRLPSFTYRRTSLPLSIVAYYLILIAISAGLYKIAQHKLQKA